MKEILEYLADLELNNNAEWYRAAKDRRDQANRAFEALLANLIVQIGRTDASIRHCVPGELTFKQVRDTRFSKDKSPYNPSLRAHIGAKGKLPVPVGYYLMIRPGNRSFLGGGLFADMFQDATARLRNYLSAHGGELERIVNAPEFKSRFTVMGSALKKVPAGYDASGPYADWLRYKCLYLEYPLTDNQLLAPGFAEQAAEIFLAMKPFNDFMNRALEGFEMPRRP